MQGCVTGGNPVEQHAGKPSHARLSLVIPALDEQDTICQAIREAVAALSATVAEYEIIVVDDGGTDKTAQLVLAEAEANPRVRLVQHSRNLGYGAALRSGFEAATLDLVAFTDADCQFDLRELDHMLPCTSRYDITCGYRIDRQDAPSRCFYSWGYNTLVKLLLGSSVRDIDCAMKIFRRDCLGAILPESCNFFANTEMLTLARQRGLSIGEVGVRHRPRLAGESKVSLVEVPRTLSALLPFWWSRVLFPGRASAASKADGWFWAGLSLLMLVTFVLLFPNLSYPLLEPDEGRYAEISREMLASGNWTVPTLYYQSYYDKPPLLYWLVAASFKLFGTRVWAARLVPASAAFLTVLATFVFGVRIMGTRAAFLAAMVLALSTGFVDFGRVLILDGVLTLAVVVSFFTAYEAIRGDRLRMPWWIASAVCCALGVLTKGPIALVLLGPPLLAFLWLSRNPVQPTRWQWAGYLAVALLVAGLWYVTIMVREPAFAYHFFWLHHIDRFFGGAFHPHSVFFYVPVLFLACMPWSLLFVPFVRFLFSRSLAVWPLRPRAMGYFLLWAGWCVLFFSLSRGKLPPYILPALPAIAMMLGYYLDLVLFQSSVAQVFQRASTIVPRHTVAVLCGGAIGVNVGAWLLRLPSRNEFLVESSLWAAAIFGVAAYGRRLGPKAAWALCCVVAMAVNYESAHRLIPAWAHKHSPLAQHDAARDLLKEQPMAVACYGREWGSIAFEFGRDEILNFSTRPPRDLTIFLAEHPRTLILLKAGAKPEWYMSAIPHGMEMTKIWATDDAMAFLVQRAASAEAGGQQQGYRLPSAN